jgi:hypothetical protein
MFKDPFNLLTNKYFYLYGMIFSPAFILFILLDYKLEFIDYSGGTPASIMRPMGILIGIGIFLFSWFFYKLFKDDDKDSKAKSK